MSHALPLALSEYDGLPFVSCEFDYQGKKVKVERALIDTGSRSTLLATDIAEQIGVKFELTDDLYRIRGVGGIEWVFMRQIERIVIGNHAAVNANVDIGALDYGIEMSAIIGTEVLKAIGAVIRMRPLLLEFEE